MDHFLSLVGLILEAEGQRFIETRAKTNEMSVFLYNCLIGAVGNAHGPQYISDAKSHYKWNMPF